MQVAPPGGVIPVTRVSDMMVGAVNLIQTPSSLPPHMMFLTEVTSMGGVAKFITNANLWHDFGIISWY